MRSSYVAISDFKGEKQENDSPCQNKRDSNYVRNSKSLAQEGRE